MSKRTIYLIPLIIGMALAAAVAAGLHSDQERFTQKTRLQVFYELSTIQNGLENALNTRFHMANALKACIAINPEIDQATFGILAKGLLKEVNGIRFIELAKDNTISHIYPENGTKAVLNRQLMLDFPLDIQDLIQRTMNNRQTQITAPKTSIDGDNTIVTATPVYRESNAQSGASPYWGVILMVIDAKSLYREAGLGSDTSSLDIALREPESTPGHDQMLHGKDTVFAQNPVIMNIAIPDGYWQVAAIPIDGWPESPNRVSILVGGVLMTCLITGLLLIVLFLLSSRFRTREKYRYLVQNAKSIIMRLDLNGNITFCNEHAESFYGYAPGELIGKPLIGTLIPEKNLEGEPMKRYINRLLQNPSAHPFNETMNVCKNGQVVWVAWAYESVLSHDGHMTELLSVGTDITDRKLMEESLRLNERRYRLLAENVIDIIWGLDTDLCITFISPSDEALRGFKRYDVLSRPISDFLTPPTERRFSSATAALKEQKRDKDHPPSMTMDMEFTCADGTTIWLESHFGLMLSEDGQIIGMQGVSRDISDRKLAEALRDDVERMARHDLKTPLGAVVGLPGEIRRMGDLNPTQEKMLETIEEAGVTMLQMINRSLDLFKMERGTYALDKRQVDVLQVMERIMNETKTLVREKGVSIGIEILGDQDKEHFWATVDECLFQSMLSNLILNALQASPEGGSTTVTFTRGERITIAIRNQGEVNPSMRDIFFEKYTSSNGSGLGLGTYSARLIARTHDGDITVDTATPGQTCVTVTLPA